MHKFQPRGIVKWAPFAALNEYQNIVEQLTMELDRDVNYRTDAFYEYIDQVLSTVNEDDEIMVNFYENEELQCEFGQLRILEDGLLEINNRKIHKGQISDIIV